MNVGPAAKTAIGLVLLTVSILVAGDFLGMIPNEQQGQLDGRKKFCENLAVQLSIAASRGEVELIQSVLNAVVDRDADVVSATIRTEDKKLNITAGSTPAKLDVIQPGRSTPDYVQVPIFNAGKRWGTVEVVFAELWDQPMYTMFNQSIIGLILFVALSGFFVYLFFIKKVLRELDPSVVPERVKSAFNVLAEGLLILDETENIILANTSFADKLEKSADKLFGMNASKLGWENRSPKNLFPWQQSLQTNKSQIGVPLKLEATKNNLRTFMVNSTPISDQKGKIRGALVTFDDMTDMEKHHRDLKNAMDQLVKSEEALRDKTVELEYLATRDSLTGCLNRRAFLEKYEEAFGQARETGSYLICVMVDLDHFKSINDRFGHTVGDKVLRSVAELLRANSRSGDLVGRYGGEEFCIVLPETDLEKGQALIERLRELIRTATPKYSKSAKRVTASFGMALLSSEIKDSAELINLADSALYIAKDRGRNRVICWNNLEHANDTLSDAAPRSTDSQPQNGQSIRLVTDEYVGSSDFDVLQQQIITLEQELEDVQSKQTQHGYDALTGLPDRDLFCNKIRDAVAKTSDEEHVIAVVSLDIDTFKRINDALGFAIGDQLLKTVAERLVNALRPTDTVALLENSEMHESSVSRLNNDEFGILIADLADVKSITWIVKRIFDLLSRKFEIDGHDIFITCSAGVSLAPNDSDDADSLVRNASAARSDAKKHFGRNHLQFFSPSIDESAYRQVWLEGQLHRAMEEKELELYYQPLIDLRTNQVCAMEALIRWPHPKLGFIPPAEFIPIAEHTDLINVISDWVIRGACIQGRQWVQQGFTDLRVAVNLSAVQFHQNAFADRLLTIIRDTGLPCRNLELEITETTLMNSFGSAQSMMTKLHDTGITFAIDDFGTGYSSLSSLKNLPVDSLKIDRSFLSDSLVNEQESMIIRAIVSMAHSLGLRVVAEGVETDVQRNFLHKLKCDEVQGYLYSKPVPAELATKLLTNSRIRIPASA